MNDKKPYKDTASFMDIVEDGWSREFKVEQTWNELVTMGYDKVPPSDIRKIWELLTYRFMKGWEETERRSEPDYGEWK